VFNPKNKTWEQQLDQIHKILENCHINIKSSNIRRVIKFWYIQRQQKSCPGFWELNSQNYWFETKNIC
jgi:hypothetical protein